MRFWFSTCALWTMTLPALAGQALGQPRPRVVEDHWDAAYLEGGKAGYVRTLVEELTPGGRSVFRTTVALKLTVKRFNQVIEIGMDTGTTETAEGKVIATFMRQYLGKNKTLEILGTVAGKELRLTRDGQPIKSAPWNDEVLGLYRQEKLLKDRNVKPGDKFSYLSFEPSVNLIITNEVEVKDYEEVNLLGRKRRLLRVETRPSQIQGVQLPTLFSWVDDNFDPLRSETDVPGLGKIALYRTTREVALAPGTGTLTDIGISQYIRLKQRIRNAYDTSTAVYRINIKGEKDPGDTFAKDARQEAKNVKGNTFELHVRASRGPQDGQKGARPGVEFTESSYFINSADALVKKFAAEAIGQETDAWKKTLRIEGWVNRRMNVTSHESLAPADHVARTLQGDCTEFAMLTAAMCRASGIPSRTAVGLIYADVNSGPVFAFHMWTEVWIRGQWIPVDATLARGYVGATHLKITDSSWYDERSLTPLLPVVRVLGRMTIDVVRTE